MENWLLPLLVLAMEVKVLQKEVDKKSSRTRQERKY